MFTVKTTSCVWAVLFRSFIFCGAVRVSLFFETSQATAPYSVPGIIFLWEALGPSDFLVIFFPFAHPVCSCPLSLTVRARIRLFFWQEWKAPSPCRLAVSVSTSRVCLMPREVTGSSRLQKSANKSSASPHLLPLDCSFYPNLTMETNTLTQGPPHPPPPELHSYAGTCKGRPLYPDWPSRTAI